MYEINKAVFGEFLASLRKEKGYTQKELAEKLFVSDKAVSKWERALSMPDISLLMPLADLLGVSVTELLEGRRLEKDSGMEVERVEVLVQKALALSEDTPEKKRARAGERAAVFGGCVLFALLELLIGWLLRGETAAFGVSILVFELISFWFGIYFWFFMKDRLPSYYDENRINAITDGFFRMNIPGVYFNNSNWPHITAYLRGWSAVTMVAVPFLSLLADVCFTDFWPVLIMQNLFVIGYLVSIFVPVCVLGKKYGMEKDGKKGRRPVRKVIIAIMAILAAGLLILAVYQTGSFQSAVRIGFVSGGGLEEWSASYSMLDGFLSRKLYPQEEDSYRIEIHTESGSISVEMIDKDGNIFFSEYDMPSGSFPVTLNGTTKVKITADHHRGSFAIVR